MGFPWGKTFLLGLAYFGISLFWPLLDSYVPPMLAGFGLGAAGIGFVMTMDNYAGLLVQPFAGNLSDRIRTPIGRRKPFMLIGAPVAAAAFIMIPLAPSLLTLTAAFAVASIALSTFRSPTMALLGDLFPPEQRSRANGVVILMGGLALILAFLGGAALYDVNESAALPFLVAALLMLAVIALVALTIREPPAAVMPGVAAEIDEPRVLPPSQLAELEPRSQSALAVLRAVLTQPDRTLALMLLSILCWNAGINVIASFFTLFGQNELGISVSDASRMLAYFAIAGVVFALPAGFIAARFGQRPVMLVCLAILALAFAPIYFVHDQFYIQAVLIVAGAALTTIRVSALPMLLNTAPAADTGSFTGQYFALSSLAAIIGPPLAGLVVQVLGDDYSAIFLISPLFILLALLALVPAKSGQARLRPESELT